MVPKVIRAEQRGLKEPHQLLESFPSPRGDPHHVHPKSLARINYINLGPTQTVRGNVRERTEYLGSLPVSAIALAENLLSQL